MLSTVVHSWPELSGIIRDLVTYIYFFFLESFKAVTNQTNEELQEKIMDYMNLSISSVLLW